MTSWEDLTTAALLGTERRTVDVLALSGPLGDATAALDAARQTGQDSPAVGRPDAAAALLDAAALATAYRRAGARPDARRVAPVAPAGPEPSAPVSGAAAARLAGMLAEAGKGDNPELLREWLAAATARGRHAPSELLPVLLDLATRDTSFGAAAAPVLGVRGRWLAQFRPDWTRVVERHAGTGAPVAAVSAEDASSVWASGDTTERRSAFTALRATDPAAACDLLRTTWAAESGDDREVFVSALATGLSADDEDLLETALDDRRKGVREPAALLLRRLPDSAYAHRMRKRAVHVMRSERKLLRTRLVVTPPTTADKAMVRDGFVAKPAAGTGQQAWLLRQLLSMTPLSVWSQLTGLTPAQLVGANVDEWGKELLHGWTAAAVEQGDAQWARALLDAHGPPSNGAESQRAAELVVVLDPADRAEYVATIARTRLSVGDAQLVPLLACVLAPWPQRLTDVVLAWMAKPTGRPHAWTVRETTDVLGRRMPPATAATVTSLADRLPDDSPWRPPLQRVAQVLTFRHQMLEELT